LANGMSWNQAKPCGLSIYCADCALTVHWLCIDCVDCALTVH
jgi:hypothetical protein